MGGTGRRGGSTRKSGGAVTRIPELLSSVASAALLGISCTNDPPHPSPLTNFFFHSFHFTLPSLKSLFFHFPASAPSRHWFLTGFIYCPLLKNPTIKICRRCTLGSLPLRFLFACMPQRCLHFMPDNTSPSPSNLSLVLHCPEPTHSLTSALHHCLDFMMTFSCSYVPHVDRIHDLHLSTLFTFPFLFVILPFLSVFISSSSCVCACPSPSIFCQTTVPAPNPTLSHISHTVPCSCPRSFQPRLSYQHPH